MANRCRVCFYLHGAAMTDTLSVLLLIGSAVTGPVEAQLLAGPDLPPIRCTPTANGTPNCTGPRESLDQLCERAMREIGAINNGRWYMPPQTRDEQLAPLFVRCIPTPKGYRK